MLPEPNVLWNYYLSGLLRNINAILAGVYGGALGIPGSNRSRGERSDEVLAYLIQNQSISQVVTSILRVESRITKQGTASLHDLALGHVLLCTCQYSILGEAGRAASVLSSSMLLGSVVPLLRNGFQTCRQHYPTRPIDDLSEGEFSRCMGAGLSQFDLAFQKALKNETRGQHLRKLREQLGSAQIAVGLFEVAAKAGLDDRPFDHFLTDEETP